MWLVPELAAVSGTEFYSYWEVSQENVLIPLFLYNKTYTQPKKLSSSRADLLRDEANLIVKLIRAAIGVTNKGVHNR